MKKPLMARQSKMKKNSRKGKLLDPKIGISSGFFIKFGEEQYNSL